ncbi:MAG: glycosyl transferase [Bacteroidota bacterium]|nr:glycosyl transferase [Bacteroidota bacterium]MDX5429962.1 glycosyl transferase [Bacteroidota bacterium]MDX5468735.1 glycosyl transferase [Bacteroidota bacterium]
MNRLNFCTLFDSNYLSRGLVMYDSLEEHCDNFHLYVFAFNDLALNTLRTLSLPHMTVISLQEFEDPELLAVKSDRSRAEYCWTCTSSTIHYVLEKYQVENCTYLDADMVFYSNPRVLIEEMEASGKSVLITSHRYTRRYDQSLLRGKYCVQFMYFKNNEQGREVLDWWRARCLEWCYARVEDGKFGDQKYLDDWTTRFPSVHELEHLGGGIAPWNCQQFSFKKEGNSIIVSKGNQKAPVVFFHFHGVKIYPEKKSILAPRSYQLSSQVKSLFYIPYLETLWRKGEFLNEPFPNHDFHGTGKYSDYRKEKFFIGHYSWLKRNLWARIFPPKLP